MYEYDILVSMRFLSKAQGGGRSNLPPIKDNEYSYRPIFRLEKDTIGYCCGIVIGDYIENYNFDTELLNIKVLFLQFSAIKNKLYVGKKFKLFEGNMLIGTGQILKIKE
ncbi:hypothetical protein [Treponema parvum]|jgi:hypothetical protein|uniref:hypothetical protein n=1 Tax=Treponema parvum TaxID=138851 RepID=UPI001AEBB21F|nr:hypothetical protein [Treponema parvum]QTQ16352.1 hypothetical protein HXT04_06415 [Treponema parvum]